MYNSTSNILRCEFDHFKSNIHVHIITNIPRHGQNHTKLTTDGRTKGLLSFLHLIKLLMFKSKKKNIRCYISTAQPCSKPLLL